MIEVTSCVICAGEIRTLRRALVAPFIARRIWDKKPFNIDLACCRKCGFIFYNPRLDEGDLQNLYTGYRSQEYQKMRYRYEPWYSEKMNAALGLPESYAQRRSVLSGILKTHLRGRKIRRVLDHGGDRGDLAAGLIDGAEAFVYDISGVSPVANVTAVSDLAACQADLIINSNVLEHVGFPRDLVTRILQALPDGGLVFIEVPCEDPFGSYRLARRIAQVSLTMLLRPKSATSLIQPSALYMMHEHINYFTERSLSELMRNAGGRAIASGSYPISGAAGRADIAWYLGSKN
jgi:hypothetical protein